MSNEFQPYSCEKNAHDFDVWDFHVTKEIIPVVNPEDELLKEYERLKAEASSLGYSEGLQQAQAEINNLKAELGRWVHLIQNPVQLIDKQLTQELMQVIIWLSQECIGVELSLHPEKIGALIEHIKDELPALKNNKQLAMHPDDISWIKQEMKPSEFPELHELLLSDPTLHRGDFYLKGEHNDLDGRLQTRLNTLFGKYINKEYLTTPDKAKD